MMAKYAFAALFCAGACFGADLSGLLKSVEERYNRAQTLQVQFRESYTAPGRPTTMEAGTLSLRKPGRMRWDYTSPAGKLFISDGKTLWLYVPKNNRVEKMKVKESEDMRAPLAFLLGKLNFSKEFRNIQSRQEGEVAWIAAEPKSDSLPYSKVEFAVTPDARITRVRVTGLDRSVIDFGFENEKRNPVFDSKMFQFQMPAGAELVEAGQ